MQISHALCWAACCCRQSWWRPRGPGAGVSSSVRWAKAGAFRPGGPRVLVLYQDEKRHECWVLNPESGKAVAGPLEHDAAIWSACFSTDGQRIVTARFDKTAKGWDARTGKLIAGPLRHEKEVRQASFSPDGKQVVTASDDNSAKIWDAQTGKLLARPLTHRSGVLHAVFSPNGMQVVTTGEDGTAVVWDTQTGKLGSARPLHHSENPNDLLHASFSADGKLLVTGGWMRRRKCGTPTLVNSSLGR